MKTVEEYLREAEYHSGHYQIESLKSMILEVQSDTRREMVEKVLEIWTSHNCSGYDVVPDGKGEPEMMQVDVESEIRKLMEKPE